MGTREQRLREITNYLHEHFPAARIGSSTDGLTANEVFTVTDGDTNRYVEVTRSWLEGDDAARSLREALRQWELAREVRSLDANRTVRVGSSGLERIG